MHTPFRIIHGRKGTQHALQDTFANVAQSQTDASLVTAKTGKRIAVFAGILVSDTATDVTFNSKPSGSGGSAISMTFPNGDNGGALATFNPHAWFITKTGEGLTVTTGAGGETGIQVLFAYID